MTTKYFKSHIFFLLVICNADIPLENTDPNSTELLEHVYVC